jgi:SAM-dependent methyltransferase
VPYHLRSPTYDVPGFLRGRSTLDRVEIEEVGNVRGKKLLHLQCHIGLDTLSWARRGAAVTGVDFSPKAIEAARDLASRAGLRARFVQADVYELPRSLRGRFDIVFTSAGVLAWLPDLDRWARSVSACLKNGGFLFLYDFHPVLQLFDDAKDQRRMIAHGSYFHQSLHENVQGTYADWRAPVRFPRHQWKSSLEDVLGATLQAGLRPERFHEYDTCGYPHFPFLRQGSDGFWRMPRGGPRIPLMFSIRARKPTREP